MAIDQRFQIIDQRFQAIDQRFQALERRILEIEQRIETIEASFHSIQQELRELRSALPEMVMAPIGFILEFLGTKGAISKDEADFLVKSCKALLKLRSSTQSSDPVTQHQRDFVKELLERDLDQFTLEELDRALEILREWMQDELIEETPRNSACS